MNIIITIDKNNREVVHYKRGDSNSLEFIYEVLEVDNYERTKTQRNK